MRLQRTVEKEMDPSKSNEGFGRGTLIGKGLATSAKEFAIGRTMVVTDK